MVPAFLNALGFSPTPPKPLRAAHVQALAASRLADDIVQEGNARLARSVPVGVSASRPRRHGTGAERVTLFWDPEFPDLGWLALGDGFPPVLWAPVDAEHASEILDAYLRAPDRTRAELSSVLRLIHGFVDELGLNDLEIYERVVGQLETWRDDGCWREGVLDDPWPPAGQSLSLLARYSLQERAATGHGDRRSSSTHRAHWSRGTCTLERTADLWGLELRYNPVPQGETLAIQEELLPARFREIPVDLLAMTLRGRRMDVPALRELYAEEPEDWHMLAWQVLDCTSAEALAMLRARAERPESTAMMIEIAALFNHIPFQLELLATASDPAIVALLEERLRPHAAPPEQDELDDDDDDDDDYDDEDDDDDDDDWEDDE